MSYGEENTVGRSDIIRNMKGFYMILPPNHNSQDLTTISSNKGVSRFYIWSFWTFYLRFINKDMRPRGIETPHGAGPSWSWNHWVPRRQTGRTSQGTHVDTEQQNAISKSPFKPNFCRFDFRFWGAQPSMFSLAGHFFQCGTSSRRIAGCAEPSSPDFPAWNSKNFGGFRWNAVICSSFHPPWVPRHRSLFCWYLFGHFHLSKGCLLWSHPEAHPETWPIHRVGNPKQQLDTRTPLVIRIFFEPRSDVQFEALEPGGHLDWLGFELMLDLVLIPIAPNSDMQELPSGKVT